VDDSEVLENTNPTPRGRPGHETVERSGQEADDLRQRLRQPPSSVQFQPVEEDVEEISLDPPDPEPVVRRPEPVRAPDTPRPTPPLRPPPPAPSAPRPDVTATTVPVSLEVRPGTPVETEVSIPVQVMVGGRLTQVQINLRLILDLKLQK
jgi:hypothetical protein